MIRPITNIQTIPTYYKSKKVQNNFKNQTTISSTSISFKSVYFNDSNKNYQQLDKNINSENLAQIEKRKLEYAESLKEIKNNQITPRLLDLIVRERQGKLTEMPNCVMLSCGSKDVNNDLIEWTKNNAECRVITMDINDDILEKMEDAHEHYQKEREWTLLHVKNFTDLINPNITKFSTIEGVKALMSAAAERFNTTILFTAEHPEELDEIAIETHRVRHITGDLKSADELIKEDAWNRLLNESGVYTTQETPINQRDKEALYYSALSDNSTLYTQGKYIFTSGTKDLIRAAGLDGRLIIIPSMMKYVIPDTQYVLSTDFNEKGDLKDVERIIDDMLKSQFDKENFVYRKKSESTSHEYENIYIRNPFYDLQEFEFTPEEEFLGVSYYHPNYYGRPNAGKDEIIFERGITATRDEIDLENPDTTKYRNVNNAESFKGSLQLAILGGFLQSNNNNSKCKFTPYE